jgi:NAD(P)-dependent dehydrogenase (short-subunit alcohol dehydrogenase family)
MRRRDRGTIVQIGSALAYRSIPLQSACCASKAAIRAFTDSLRSEPPTTVDNLLAPLPGDRGARGAFDDEADRGPGLWGSLHRGWLFASILVAAGAGALAVCQLRRA